MSSCHEIVTFPSDTESRSEPDSLLTVLSSPCGWSEPLRWVPPVKMLCTFVTKCVLHVHPSSASDLNIFVVLLPLPFDTAEVLERGL